jgi:hypothetical protein
MVPIGLDYRAVVDSFPRMGTALPCIIGTAFQKPRVHTQTRSASPLHYPMAMMLRTITTSFDLWSTEQLLLVYQRYYGKLDAQARRRIIETARLNGWDRTWRDGVELLAA